jgi:predicted lipoprotein with Yx(FWY)xxD motif
MARRFHPVLLGLVALAAGCGDEEPSASAPPPAPAAPTMAAADANGKSNSNSSSSAAATGTKIVLGRSEFGTMLFNRRKQAIYIFQRDAKARSNCYGECAVAWPPVYTKGRPRAGKGVRASLLGTTKRRDGRRQVTYDGQPLYYYAHEDPGQVLCHNVNLNGGLWWVVGPDGRRRP